MIAFIKGTVDSLSEGKMILESHGIGYVQAIAKTPGIGKKTAQKLILELKDKFDLQEAFEQKLAGNQAAAAVRQTGEPDAFQDAVQALTALGYSGTEALQAVKKVEITEGMDSEAVLKAALKHMF